MAGLAGSVVIGTAMLDEKTRSSLVARAALVGVVLVVTEDDRGRPNFIASRWSLTKQMSTPEEVDRFLRRIGGEDA